MASGEVFGEFRILVYLYVMRDVRKAVNNRRGKISLVHGDFREAFHERSKRSGNRRVGLALGEGLGILAFLSFGFPAILVLL